jgi:hypothetical protein
LRSSLLPPPAALHCIRHLCSCLLHAATLFQLPPARCSTAAASCTLPPHSICSCHLQLPCARRCCHHL